LDEDLHFYTFQIASDLDNLFKYKKPFTHVNPATIMVLDEIFGTSRRGIFAPSDGFWNRVDLFVLRQKLTNTLLSYLSDIDVDTLS
jgi:hypothetical protein